jgi:hypothetical protein
MCQFAVAEVLPVKLIRRRIGVEGAVTAYMLVAVAVSLAYLLISLLTPGASVTHLSFTDEGYHIFSQETGKLSTRSSWKTTGAIWPDKSSFGTTAQESRP